MQLDIIIVNYKSTAYLIKCIESIYDSVGRVSVNILVQDNASGDGVERIKEIFPQVRLCVNSANIGFGAAVNRAIRKSSAPYVMLLNPDTTVVSGVFDLTVDYLEANADVGIVGPKILDSDGTIQGSARSFPTPLTAFFGRTSLITRLFPNNRITTANLLTRNSDGITPMEVDWVSGACMVVRRQAINEVGVFDERFFMYWEDADWCRRMWDHGWKVAYFPRAAILHLVGKSSSKLFTRSILEFHKSVYRLFEKYNRPSIWLLKPLIIMGLFLRSSSLIASNNLYGFIKKEPDSPDDIPYAAPPKRIKILRMIARLNIGGPAIHVHLLTKGLDPQKFETKLVTGKISAMEGDMSYLFDNEGKQPTLIPELQREISLKMDLKAWFQIFRILRHVKPDIVHTHTAKAGFSARFAVLIYNLLFDQNVYIVHTFHGHVFEGYFPRIKSYFFVLIERLIAIFTDAIIAISKTQRFELVEKYKIAPAWKIKAIELGFNLKPFLIAKSSRGRFREKIGISNNEIVIGIIGRLVPIKNHKMLLDAAKLLIERNSHMAVKFVIVGDGELRLEIETYCKKINMEDYVHFCGWVFDVPIVYADLDILALTSKNEGTPVSIIEAMAACVPVIATNAGGVKDLIGDVRMEHHHRFSICERGFLARNNDANCFARGLEYIIYEEQAETDRRNQKARSFVQHTYNQHRLLKSIESLYTDIMQDREVTKPAMETPLPEPLAPGSVN
jgi:GT2 family glycosyltransferase/glycosyltransferase involved in cell wall biosynthesis